MFLYCVAEISSGVKINNLMWLVLYSCHCYIFPLSLISQILSFLSQTLKWKVLTWHRTTHVLKWNRVSPLPSFCAAVSASRWYVLLSIQKGKKAVIFHKPASSKVKRHIKNTSKRTGKQRDAGMTDCGSVQTEGMDVYNVWGKDILENNLGTARTASKRKRCCTFNTANQAKIVEFSTQCTQSCWMIHWGQRSSTLRIALWLCAQRHFQTAEQNESGELTQQPLGSRFLQCFSTQQFTILIISASIWVTGADKYQEWCLFFKLRHTWPFCVNRETRTAVEAGSHSRI